MILVVCYVEMGGPVNGVFKGSTALEFRVSYLLILT